MLNKLRNRKISKKIWIVLTILILPAFVLWGSGSVMRNKQDPGIVGKIFGRKISSLEYQDALLAVRNQAIIQFGDNLSEVQKYLNLESQAWERLILLAEAKRRKIKVSDKETIDLIESYPFFQRKDGFNQASYASILRYEFRTAPRIFEEQARQNLMLSKLYKEVTKEISLTEEETKREYIRNNETVSIYYISGLYDDFLKDVAISEEQTKDYFSKNSFQFREPLSFNLEYAAVNPENTGNEGMQEKIQKILLRLSKKEDFNKVSKDFNLTLKETGIFRQNDPIPGIGWSPEILMLISKARSGDLLPPVYIDKNYYLMKLKERKEPYIPDFETIKEKVKAALTKEKTKELAKGKLEECLGILKETYKNLPVEADFDKAAKELGLKSGSTDLFKFGSYIEGIGASDIFWVTIQNLKDGGFSEILEMPSGYYVVKEKSRVPIDEKKFTAEKEEFAKKLLLQKKQEYFTRFFEDLKIKLQAY